MVKTALSCFFVLGLVACSSSQKKETPSTPKTWTHETAEPKKPSIDINALQSHLRMDRDVENLGLTEKAFNTCEAGYGFSRSQNCHQEYFVVLHFRLQCRDTDGTISEILTDEDLSPLAGRKVKWTLKNLSGTADTDGLGYGQIRINSPISQKKQRVRLSIGSEFLYMRANEITKVITPLPWCSAR